MLKKSAVKNNKKLHTFSSIFTRIPYMIPNVKKVCSN